MSRPSNIKRKDKWCLPKNNPFHLFGYVYSWHKKCHGFIMPFMRLLRNKIHLTQKWLA